VSFGDGSTEATELYGQLGTAFRGANDVLRERLMAAWRQVGAPHSGFFGGTVLKIDETLLSAGIIGEVRERLSCEFAMSSEGRVPATRRSFPWR
jgi:hypothetical protein